MTIDGDTIEIELDMDIDEVISLKDFVADRLEYIEAIDVVGEMKTFASSSLFQLLVSIKKSRPSIKIDAIDSDLRLSSYGVIQWSHYD